MKTGPRLFMLMAALLCSPLRGHAQTNGHWQVKAGPLTLDMLREMTVFVVATPTRESLRQEFQRLVAERKSGNFRQEAKHNAATSNQRPYATVYANMSSQHHVIGFEPQQFSFCRGPRLCHPDQPQQPAQRHAVPHLHVLRLVLRTQPRSAK